MNGQINSINSLNKQVSILQSRLDDIFHLTNDFVFARSESEIIRILINEIWKQAQAIGVSFISFEELGHSQTIISPEAVVPTININNWQSYISDPSITIQCKSCRRDQPVSRLCPLLSNPFSEFEHVHCFRLENEKIKIGVVNIYLLNSNYIDNETIIFFQALTDTAAKFIKKLRQHKKEIHREISKWKASQYSQPQVFITDDEKNNIIQEERSRLAREIHDGLAQILGFLKLNISQMLVQLEENKFDQLTESLDTSYMAVSSAYIDAREAIDDLHVNSQNKKFSDWITQTGSEFETTFKISTKVTNFPLNFDLPPSIQIHVTRIIQETLSNIRKHAKSTSVEINFKKNSNATIIQVIDNGIGFQPDKIEHPSNHGIRSMKERADIINTKLDIISQPNKGTLIQLEMPDEILC